MGVLACSCNRNRLMGLTSELNAESKKATRIRELRHLNFFLYLFARPTIIHQRAYQWMNTWHTSATPNCHVRNMDNTILSSGKIASRRIAAISWRIPINAITNNEPQLCRCVLCHERTYFSLAAEGVSTKCFEKQRSVKAGETPIA